MSPRETARLIWQAGVDAVKPAALMGTALAELSTVLAGASRVVVLGGGKAGAAMAHAVEEALVLNLDRVTGWINVPEGSRPTLRRIHAHPARPVGSNQPTAAGAAGSAQILRLAREAGSNDVALCLLSGGGSALLPAPAPGLTLEDKQDVTLRLHRCGATIQEMNAVRKHLSAIKGGRLAQAFRGKSLHSLIISDVIGDPLDVIASGPTAPDPSTFADALAILDRFQLRDKVPASVRRHLEEGAAGRIPETAKALPDNVHNVLIGNNRTAYDAAWAKAESLGFQVESLGQPIAGPADAAAREAVIRIRRAKKQGGKICLLGGGETTVTLPPDHGKGGRNQEWVLAALCELGEQDARDVVLLSGGTDGEDGPTDAAGALADALTLRRAETAGLNPRDHLRRHDAYPFFEATGDLLKTGLTNTNVMDLQVVLVGAS